MYDARAISNFLIRRAEAKSAQITAMTLLKVLYFSHAWFLAKYERPLVAQPFEAWKYGPVCRVVYDQFKEQGEKPISKYAVSFDPIKMNYIPTIAEFGDDIEIFLENIFDYYTQYNAYKLSDLTHEKGGPWHQIWQEAEKRAIPGMIIPNHLIGAWFKEQGAILCTDRERRHFV
jgi:uncharacterized phage-associated protein